jgi:hypothetical protein
MTGGALVGGGVVVGDRVRWETGGALFGGGAGWKGLVCEGSGSFRVRQQEVRQEVPLVASFVYLGC